MVRGRVRLLRMACWGWALVAVLGLDAAVVRAFPIPVGAEVSWETSDQSRIVVEGPASPGGPPTILHFYKRKLFGQVTQFDASVPYGGQVTFVDRKNKRGRVRVDTVVGDPLALLSGEITEGSGYIDITAVGVPGLFPQSRANLTFVEGLISAAITVPGDQLSGPDGNDTFIDYTSAWSSYDSIGTYFDGSDTYDIVLGQFGLDSIGRPSSFYYTLDGNVGHADFTTGEGMGLRQNQVLPGTVTKEMDFVIIPEPVSIAGLAVGGLALLRRRRR